MKIKKSLYALAIVVTLPMLGCTSIGSAPDANNPPRLVESNNMPAWDGMKRVEALWDRRGAFGPVPAELQARGDGICQAAGFRQAVGYHPAARGVDGQAVDGGGYLCGGTRQAS